MAYAVVLKPWELNWIGSTKLQYFLFMTLLSDNDNMHIWTSHTAMPRVHFSLLFFLGELVYSDLV